jgi:hypothetical protein
MKLDTTTRVRYHGWEIKTKHLTASVDQARRNTKTSVFIRWSWRMLGGSREEVVAKKITWPKPMAKKSRANHPTCLSHELRVAVRIVSTRR